MAASGYAKNNSELRVFGSLDDLATDLAEYIAQLSEMSVKERGFFTIALTGGSLIYLMRKLSEAPYNKTVDWAKWYVFWADERAVAKNHVDSNYKLTKDGFLSKVSILNSHIYSINDNLTVEEAAGEYEFTIRQLVKLRIIDVSEHNDCPKFDLILLELGSDGHIASLFPHQKTLEHKMDWVTYITNSPESPPERITFSIPVINSASNVAILATGDGKAMALQLVVDRSSSFDAFSLPARLVNPTEGKLLWFVDKAAASFIDSSDESEHFEI
ncbi:probable 6-phosphogluconolactonase 1 [Phalaenopsis equestris]|uniref:probable 6-phosphogluconolactonase 1 n=1 Tax=Phalaenopsis equestris TaxID=78828 RepID=UPI0009E354DF|nr:probable 6-phosphogluconolactonase 1 [Phalaenopsis equestris]XP_020582339.1 probable 6-phosphogluconolactonase 1 [Phalaenopsis equestris]XP_020582340.1 probable 6-phosphogluconolactonase 1 [Phalaenopsis equestris]XP_020582341.1 probable 6-phosphogluconolactonase 1 [Phalaenopsis equestris]